MTNPVRTRLEQARTLIASPHNWQKGSLCNGHGRFCLVGAVQAACQRAVELQTRCLKQLGFALPLEFDSLPAFNDHQGTKHSDVLALFDQAIDLID